MSDATKRLEAWQAKFSPEKAKATLDARYEGMSAHYHDAVAALCAMETKVKQVLDEHKVQTIQYVFYLDYGRQLFKLTWKQEISGDSFALAAQVLLEKWQARGLDADVLAAVRTGVFNAPAPQP
jgi:hypothetical protein